MRLMFVYWRIGNAGSAQDILRYTEAAKTLGHEVVMYAPKEAGSPFECSLDLESADAVILVFEWNLYLFPGGDKKKEYVPRDGLMGIGHLNVAKANRALAGIQAIRTAEEAFRAQNGQYLDCSADNARWYPMTTPSKLTYEWHQFAHPDYARWMGLGVAGIKSTQYGFLVSAGNPSVAYPTLQTASKPVLPTSADHWYVIQVKGDIDGNGTFMLGAATSINGEVYLEHEGE